MPTADVVIIGGGTAGLVAGALLAYEGHHVVVLEPSDRLGGFSATYEVDGFTLNHGGHLLEDPGSGITAIFRHLGLDLVHGPTSTDMPVWDTADGRWGSVRDRYGGSRDALKRVIETIVDTPWDEFDRWDDEPLRAWLHGVTDDHGVIELFEFLAFLEFLTTHWWEHSASDSLYLRKLHFGERQTAGYSFWPQGGWNKLFEDLAGVITTQGGEVRTGVHGRVRIEQARIAGVDVRPTHPEVPNDLDPVETIATDATIVALPAWSLHDAVPRGALPDWYEGQFDLLADPRHRDAWLSIALATTEPIPILDRHELAVWESSPAAGLPGFLFEQTAYDPTTAPPGTHLYVAGGAVPGPWHDDPELLAQRADALESDLTTMLPGLREAVWRRRQFVFDPSIGVASKPMLVGHYRPHWQAPNVAGLWFAHETLRSRGIEDDRAARAALTTVEDLLGHRVSGLTQTWRY